MAAKKLIVATVTFACELDGCELVVHAGDILESTHPAVKGREKLFEPAGLRSDIDHDGVSPEHGKRLR
jgi:hypothetical protein